MLFDELTVPMFYTKRGRQAALAMLVLGGIGFVYAAIHTVVIWHSDYVLAHKPATVVMPMIDEASQFIQQIPAAHLFGQAATDEDSVPITSLQLHLTGIISMPGKENLSRALISEQGRPAKVYRLGDVLTSGHKVYAINTSGIVLNRNGHLEKLPLSRSRLSFDNRPKSLWQDNP